MKSPADVVALVERRLASTWATTVLLEQGGASHGWPKTFSIGVPSSADMAADFTAVVDAVHTWRTWKDQAPAGVEVDFPVRRVAGTVHELPTRVQVANVDAAANVAGGPWPDLLARARRRRDTLIDRFPAAVLAPGELRAVAALDKLEFTNLCVAAAWFRDERADLGPLTPRQVPLEGVHAKWLNHRTTQDLVRTLSGLEDLGLLDRHPPRIHFTYLDPVHLDGGGRRHDSYTVGDDIVLPYPVRVVVISENKDTAIGFGRIPGGIAVEGEGSGAGAIAATPFIAAADAVFYWGDMDADGLQILNQFREADLDVASLFMDLAAYETYRRFGVNVDRKNQPLSLKQSPVDRLVGGERELYDYLASGDAPVLRVEQERIPLETARDAVLSALAARL